MEHVLKSISSTLCKPGKVSFPDMKNWISPGGLKDGDYYKGQPTVLLLVVKDTNTGRLLGTHACILGKQVLLSRSTLFVSNKINGYSLRDS